MSGLENFSNETNENLQNNQSENSDTQIWSPNNGRLSEIRAQGDAESEQSGQDADDLLRTIDPQQPGKLVDVLTLDEKYVESLKNEKLDSFGRWIQGLLGKGEDPKKPRKESTKQEIANNIEGLFGPGGVIIYKSKGKSKIIPIKELYDKVKDGTLDVAWDKVRVINNSVCRFAHILEYDLPGGGTEKIPQILFQSITISDEDIKTDSDIKTGRYIK